MAALVLSFAGAALGGTLGAAGAVAGRLVGAVAGAMIDRALFGPRAPEGPRLKDLDVMSSTEGSPIPRVYGRVRIAGQVIWATKLEEHASGGGKGAPRPRTYSYTANFAVGLCEGPIAAVRRIWADGKELDQRGLTIRVHRGTEDQAADPLIVAKEGAGLTPAYRGLAYVVFERLNLDDFGSRIPQLTFEVIRPVGALEEQVRSVVIIPGATEFGYEPGVHSRDFGYGRSAPETRHTSLDASDFSASIDELQALCPKLESVSLVVAWFGDDLRAGHCTIRPKVERRDKDVAGLTWFAAGETRATAALVSEIDGQPAYGGSPSDATVIRAIRDLKERGLKVTLIPFVMMDVPADNDLPDPHSGAANQPAYPWRGRITCDPAPGRPGSPHGAGGAAAQASTFLGTAARWQFLRFGEVVIYLGAPEWRYRRFILHMANLAAAADGVDAFVIGSEMIGLTRVRSAAGHPFVDGLVALAEDVKEVLPAATLTYAADWTEYGSHAEGGDLHFPLDPLWASDAIGAVGIDWYAPLDDRRDGTPGSAYDVAQLRAALSAGEAHDWFYASDADRLAGIRTPITDGLGKPWVHRQKDLWNWWSNSHVRRVAGVETAATGWVPESKPVWLTEAGFPAVDRGANRPSVFPDAKSSEAGLPPFSNGGRDDLVQRRALEAVVSRFDPELGATEEDNPPLGEGGRMVDPARTALWAWDARPWPAFPRASDVWSDGANWDTGHWLNGRLGSAPVGDLMARILADWGIEDVDASAVEAVVDGLVIDRPMSARDALEPLARAFGVDMRESGGMLVLGGAPGGAISLGAISLGEGDLADEDGRSLVAVTRRDDGQLPVELSIAFSDTEADFRASAVTSRRLAGESRRVSSLALATAADPGEMSVRAETLLHRLWSGREQAAFALPPSRLALEPGDEVSLTAGGRTLPLRLGGLEGTLMRRAEAESFVPPVRPARPRPVHRAYRVPPGDGRPAVAVLDLPPLTEAEPPVLQYIAAASDPWRGPYTVWRGGEGSGDEAVGSLATPSLMGRTLTTMPDGRPWLWDRGEGVVVELVRGALESLPEAQVLGGGNSFAIEGADGWEVVQFRDATLIAERTWRLTHLLRGQRGTEHRIGAVSAGASVVFLSGPLAPLGAATDLIGRPFRYRVGSSVLLAADPAMAEVEAAATATALLPFAPVHLKARREAGGIRLSWVRRTRLGGDGWEFAEVPLGETTERYRLAILATGGAELRVVETPAAEHLYPSADEIADFGAPQTELRISVAQMSALAGPGMPAEAVLAL
jgi:hypothetical protein